MIQCLRENGVEVIECNTPQNKSKLKKYWKLIKRHREIKKDYDIMVVGFAGHAIMPLAWVLAKLNRKKIVLDLFVSEYDSLILDREQHSKFSLQALKFWILDWLSCRLADLCLLDADEHIKFFSKHFKVNLKKFKTIFVSTDPKIFYPRNKDKNEKFTIHYHGSKSPIQGLKYIVKAAEILQSDPSIQINIIGKLNNHEEEIKLAQKLNLKNVNFVNFLPYEELAKQLGKADICLGMFGDTDKAMHCSAFKIVEAMASRLAVVTGDTPALRELSPGKQLNCLFCKMADSKDLADSIMELKNNKELRENIAENGYQFYLKHLTPKATGADLIKILAEIIKK